MDTTDPDYFDHDQFEREREAERLRVEQAWPSLYRELSEMLPSIEEDAPEKLRQALLSAVTRAEVVIGHRGDWSPLDAVATVVWAQMAGWDADDGDQPALGCIGADRLMAFASLSIAMYAASQARSAAEQLLGDDLDLALLSHLYAADVQALAPKPDAD